MFKFNSHVKQTPNLDSRLYDQNTFYKQFNSDLRLARSRIIIESPFITSRRTSELLSMLRQAVRRGVSVTINTREPCEHRAPYDEQARQAITNLQEMGIKFLFTGGLHRKVAIIDNDILWEGSLNILSQIDSSEIMRRCCSIDMVSQMKHFTGLY